MDLEELGTGLANYLKDNDDPGPFLAAVDVLYSDESRERADEVLALVAEAARQRVVRRRQRELRRFGVMLRVEAAQYRRRTRLVPFSRSRRRESHGLSAGHRRCSTRSSAKSGDSGDDGSAEPAPALALAPERCHACGGPLLWISDGQLACGNRACPQWAVPA